jgi:uncharacterized membrane protein YhaH (DUF805 family)
MAGDMPVSPSVLAVLLANVVALTGLARCFRSLEGTTLRAPWYWTLATVLVVTAAELAAEFSTWEVQIRYLAAVATFCPLMAVLGAKRPQDRAWQFIVLSLWVVLAIPGLQTSFGRPQAHLDLHIAWRWFLMILIVLGLFNTLPTRHWPRGVWAAAGQVCLLANHLPLTLPWMGAVAPQYISPMGVVLWCSAAALWGVDWAAFRKPQRPLDKLWLDFRDLVGTLWALRVLDRINAASSKYGWGARLTWSGWILDGEPPPAFQRSLQMLLRRFVSQKWIAQRMRFEERAQPTASDPPPAPPRSPGSV